LFALSPVHGDKACVKQGKDRLDWPWMVEPIDAWKGCPKIETW
jgi:hypothetical protein